MTNENLAVTCDYLVVTCDSLVVTRYELVMTSIPWRDALSEEYSHAIATIPTKRRVMVSDGTCKLRITHGFFWTILVRLT